MKIQLDEIRKIYERVLTSADRHKNIPEITVEFYPYVGINNKIRRRDDIIQVKISDILQNAPVEIQTALAEILIRKLYRQRIPTETLNLYQEFIKRPEIREHSLQSRKSRGRKVLNGSLGNFYDLEEIFSLINQIYFQNSIPKPNLTWSSGKTFRILGHHDATHQTIVVSKSLDDLHVPRFVVEFVVYHEMLHIKHPTIYKNGRRYNHTPAFRRDETDFAFFEAAEKWIERNVGSLKNKAKKRR